MAKANKLSIKDIQLIKRYLNESIPQRYIAIKLNIVQSTVSYYKTKIEQGLY